MICVIFSLFTFDDRYNERNYENTQVEEFKFKFDFHGHVFVNVLKAM